MKNTFTRMIGAAIVTMMLTGFAQLSVSAQESAKLEQNDVQADWGLSPLANPGARGLVGVWNVQITRLNCVTGAVIGTAPAMITYTLGGTMSDAGVQVTPSLRGPGHGIWSFESTGHYSSAFQFFRFNADGTLAGRQVVRSSIEMGEDGDTLSNSATAQIFDVGGNVIATNCSTATATRFQ